MQFQGDNWHQELHFNNMNREDGFCPCKSWKLFISSLKQSRKLLTESQSQESPLGHVGLCTLPLKGNQACPSRHPSTPKLFLPSLVFLLPTACLQWMNTTSLPLSLVPCLPYTNTYSFSPLCSYVCTTDPVTLLLPTIRSYWISYGPCGNWQLPSKDLLLLYKPTFSKANASASCYFLRSLSIVQSVFETQFHNSSCCFGDGYCRSVYEF
jgi:hypothetical protein